jgi:hypothetical protein
MGFNSAFKGLISMVTRLRAEKCWVRILVGTRNVFKEHPDCFWDQPNLIFNELRGLVSWRLNGQSVNLTTYLHLVPKLRMSVTVPDLPSYALMTLM